MEVRNDLSHQLKMTLYRPWAIEIEQWPSKNSYGNYQQMIKDLEKWSLIGVSERKAYLKYQDKLKLAINELSNFYSHTTQWNKGHQSKWLKMH